MANLVSLYTGLMGAGKSYGVVKHVIVPALQDRRTVVTNVPLVHDALREYIGHDVDVRDLPVSDEGRIQYDQIPPGAVSVIDEAWNYYPSGVTVNKMPEADKQFFAMVRHKTDDEGRSQQIVLIAQDVSDLASFVRNKIGAHYRIVNLAHVGKDNGYRVDVFKGASQVERDRLNQEFGTLDPKIFVLYKSHTLGQAAGSKAGERSVDRRATIWRHPVFRFGLPAILALGVMIPFGLSWSFDKMFGSGKPEASAPVQAPSAPVVADHQRVHDVAVQRVKQQRQKQLEEKPAEPALSQEWRIVAVMENKEQGRWLLAEGKGGLRRIDPATCTQKLEQDWCLLDGAYVTVFSGLRNRSGLAVGEVLEASQAVM